MNASSIFNDIDCRELNFDDDCRRRGAGLPEGHESFLTASGRGRKKRVTTPVKDIKTAACRIYAILSGKNHEN